jgi:CheY-like chemotaxis protein
MSVESVVGQGTTFQFELPVIEGAAPEALAPPPAPAVSAPAASLRVLVVDDEAILTELLSDLLRSVGHEVEHARDGRTALRMAQQGRFDVILSDLKMPGLDGQGLYEALCKERPDMKNRFIFTTGDVVNPDVRSFFQRTGCAYLSKPFKLEAVLQIVDQVAEGRRAA